MGHSYREVTPDKELERRDDLARRLRLVREDLQHIPLGQFTVGELPLVMRILGLTNKEVRLDHVKLLEARIDECHFSHTSVMRELKTADYRDDQIFARLIRQTQKALRCGSSVLADLLKVAVPSIERWKTEKSFPQQAMRKPVIVTLIRKLEEAGSEEKWGKHYE